MSLLKILPSENKKTIKLNETFNSYEEFLEVLQTYSKNTYQNFISRDSLNLKPKETSEKQAN
jgi:hypothetical protein